MGVDWRTWVYQRLSADSAVQALVGDRIFSTLEETPQQRPFIVIRLGVSNSELHATEGAESVPCTIWVHDDPESYVVIDEVLKTVRTALEAPVITQPDGIQAIWQGDSLDLSDDARGTVVRNSTYRLVGRR